MFDDHWLTFWCWYVLTPMVVSTDYTDKRPGYEERGERVKGEKVQQGKKAFEFDDPMYIQQFEENQGSVRACMCR